jgi:hypothetical protein
MKRRFLLLTAGIIVTLRPAIAAEAALSKDGTHAYLVVEGEPKLVEIDLGHKTCRTIDLTTSLSGPIENITPSNSGFILCATRQAIWSYDPAKSVCLKVHDAPKDANIKAIAYDPSSGQILATTTESGVFCLPKDHGQWAKVIARYDTFVGHPVFGRNGELFFVSSGDLWLGVVGGEADDTATTDEYLTAYRSAPMASPIDQDTSPASTGLRQVAVTRRLVYADSSRMGGSGWGSVIRFKRPASLAALSDGSWSIPVGGETWDDLKDIFGSVEEVSDTTCDYLCASTDGALVFFTGSVRASNEVSLIKQDGKPVTIKIKGLTDCFN